MSLRHMLPFSTMNYVCNRGSSQAISRSKFIYGDVTLGILLAYLRNLSGGKFYAWCAFPACLSILRNLIYHVVCVRAKKEVRGIAAGRVVAAMKHSHSLRNVAMRYFISGAVSTNIRAVLARHLYSAVTFGFLVALPLPTVIRAKNTNARPQTFRQWLGRLIAKLMTGDESDWFALDMAESLAVLLSQVGFLSATAVAITVRDFVRGMILHVNSPFLTLTTPQDGSTHRCGNYIPASIIPQEAGI